MKYAIVFGHLIVATDDNVMQSPCLKIDDPMLPLMYELVDTANFVTQSLPAINKRQAQLMRRAAEALDSYETMNRQDVRRIIDDLDAEAGEMETCTSN